MSVDWRNKKVLITGAEGFIGSHLVEALLSKGATVRALTLYNSFNQSGWLEKIPHVEIVAGDIRDYSTCQRITKNIEIIFHLAALISIPYSYEAPEAYISTNIQGTSNLYRAAIENQCALFLNTSSSEVYGTALYVPIDEKHPLQPQSPYSASKIGAESIAFSYYKTYGLPLITVRPFNTYGPRQSTRAIIPTIITQIARGKKEISLGNVTPKRDFTYVEDTCEGLIALAQSEEAIGEVVNIGTKTEISMRELFEMLSKLMEQDVQLVAEMSRRRPENSEVYRLCCDHAKLKKLTGFTPKISLEEGLRRTIDWFIDQSNFNFYKMDQLHV